MQINNETLGYFIGRTAQFLTSVGIQPQHLRFRQVPLAPSLMQFSPCQTVCARACVVCVPACARAIVRARTRAPFQMKDPHVICYFDAANDCALANTFVLD